MFEEHDGGGERGTGGSCSELRRKSDTAGPRGSGTLPRRGLIVFAMIASFTGEFCAISLYIRRIWIRARRTTSVKSYRGRAAVTAKAKEIVSRWYDKPVQMYKSQLSRSCKFLRCNRKSEIRNSI